jgi:SAM-dependent methyltransferase
MRNFHPKLMIKYLSEKWQSPSYARKESNKWLHPTCRNIKGDVLSIGSGNDTDNEGDYYRNYFPMATSYTTSEISEEFECDVTIDVRSMPEIKDESYDCVYCSGVLEHVDDYQAGFSEFTRILKAGGILLLGVPFHQPIHFGSQDFWRFTEHGIKYLLKDSYEIIDIVSIDQRRGTEFPSAYWIKARKKKHNQEFVDY